MPAPRNRSIEPIIAVTDPDMMRLWAERFGVDLDELQQALDEVGPRADLVQEHLTGIPALLH